MMVHVFISYCCSNTLLPRWWHKATQICYLACLEVRRQEWVSLGSKSKYEQGCVPSGDRESAFLSFLVCIIHSQSRLIASFSLQSQKLYHSDFHGYLSSSDSNPPLFSFSLKASCNNTEPIWITQDRYLHFKLMRKLNCICNLNFLFHHNIFLGLRD